MAMSATTGEPIASVPAIPAATTLIVRDNPFQVLMVRRRKSSFYSSAVVFPGGLVEPEDASEDWLPHVQGAEALSSPQRALRIAACREAYEEASILIGGRGAAESKAQFLDLVAKSGVSLPLGDIVPFGHWITPEGVKKRFDTHFYLCVAPDGADACCDGDETVSLEWVRPIEALARAASRQQVLLFPQLMNMRWLAESQDVTSAFEAARRRPVISVTPRLERREHGTVIIIPEDAGYGVTEFSAPEIEAFTN
jgi:8-oxo-dGTP pyrophosphatase MutT (NUDIX family)